LILYLFLCVGGLFVFFHPIYFLSKWIIFRIFKCWKRCWIIFRLSWARFTRASFLFFFLIVIMVMLILIFTGLFCLINCQIFPRWPSPFAHRIMEMHMVSKRLVEIILANVILMLAFDCCTLSHSFSLINFLSKIDMFGMFISITL